MGNMYGMNDPSHSWFGGNNRHLPQQVVYSTLTNYQSEINRFTLMVDKLRQNKNVLGKKAIQETVNTIQKEMNVIQTKIIVAQMNQEAANGQQNPS